MAFKLIKTNIKNVFSERNCCDSFSRFSLTLYVRLIRGIEPDKHEEIMFIHCSQQLS